MFDVSKCQWCACWNSCTMLHRRTVSAQEHHFNWFSYSFDFDDSMVLRDHLARHLGRPVIYWRSFALSKNKKIHDNNFKLCYNWLTLNFHMINAWTNLKSLSSSGIFDAFNYKLLRSYFVKVICSEILYSIKLLTPFVHAGVQFVGNTTLSFFFFYLWWSTTTHLCNN